jgi:hypothetical protein
MSGWTKTPPTEPGHYWAKLDDGTYHPVEVFRGCEEHPQLFLEGPRSDGIATELGACDLIVAWAARKKAP